MTEVDGGMKPLDSQEMRAILQRYLEKVHDAEERARALRLKVLDGRTKIQRAEGALKQSIPTDITQADIDDAKQRLQAQEEELRYFDGWELIGLSMGLVEAFAAILSETGKSVSWRPPAGSELRIYMPGLLRLTVDLHDQSFERANP